MDELGSFRRACRLADSRLAEEAAPAFSATQLEPCQVSRGRGIRIQRGGSACYHERVREPRRFFTSQSTEPLQDKVKKLAPAYAGSCALLSLYDSVTSTLHVACTGDSRVVLGQKQPDGEWEAIDTFVCRSDWPQQRRGYQTQKGAPWRRRHSQRLTGARDCGFTTFWRWSVEGAVRIIAGFEAEIL